MAKTLIKERRAECERRAWELRQKAWTVTRIAAELDIDQSTVSRMLARMEKRLSDDFQVKALNSTRRQSAKADEAAQEIRELKERVRRLERDVEILLGLLDPFQGSRG